MHLVDSVGISKLKAVCCHHEQGAVIAAEAYARIRNTIGVSLVTTGPGGTNAVTGVAGAWLDSIPMLIINGQVKTDNIVPKIKGVPAYRQLGFQEINIIDVVKSITKYAVTVENKNEIKYHLEKAIYEATRGRPGPVWIEIPLDVQAEEINEKKLKSFKEPKIKKTISKKQIDEVVVALEKAKRPLLVAGNGIRLSGGAEVLQKLIGKLKINVVTPIFTADDMVTYDYPKYLGRQGMPGNEMANWAIDNCDLMLIIGERMQLTQTSYDYAVFGRKAKMIMVDIDEGEMKKKTLKIDMPICGDAKEFLEELYKRDIKLNDWKVEVKKIEAADYDSDKGFMNVYRFLETLSQNTKGYDVVTANGMASLASHQALIIKKGQRFLTNAGLGHMGSGLPMAIGASMARNKKPIICMEGDGSIMMNLQELQTMVYHKLPLKIFLFNNGGYFSIRNTHRNFFKRLFASDASNGVSMPNFEKVTKAFGIKYFKIANNKEIKKVKEVMAEKQAVICELMIDPDQKMIDKWSAGKYFEA